MSLIEQQMEIANQHRQAGRLREAETAYHEVIAQKPDHADALHLLGIVVYQLGRPAEAAEFMSRATGLDPGRPDYFFNLGLVLAGQRKNEEAIAAFSQATVLQARFWQAWNELANLYSGLGRLADAETALRHVTELCPDEADAHNGLGVVLQESGKGAEAIESFRRAIAIAPARAEFHSNLGYALKSCRRHAEAIVACRAAIAMNPNLAEAHNNLGFALIDSDRITEAIAAYQAALRLKPEDVLARTNLGVALKTAGRIDEAIAAYRDVLRHKSNFAPVYSNLLFAMHFQEYAEPSAVFQEHLNWDRLHAKPLSVEIRPHGNDRNPDRRIRVGYVSPDFREHSVGFFIENLIAAHDPAKVEVFCYSDRALADGVTERLKKAAQHWRDVFGLNDARVAEMVRQDKIDILVDLAGHTGGNRLLVFARKPAPVQVTYLGYPDTTGLSAMDYRLTDGYVDRLGETEQWHSERVVRLPNSFACYKPPEGVREIGELPAKSRGFITFGSFNVLAKISDKTLQAWAKTLKQIPQSRLMIVAKGLSDKTVASRIVEAMVNQGIEADRLRLHGQQSMQDYLALHQDIDVVLDTFPVNGHTVTCHALWMGVPVVCLAGKTCCQRLGTSVLSTLGLNELIANDAEEYVRIAVNLANDIPKLSSLRLSLRGKMVQSPLMDAKAFARDVESAYRQMWRGWCESKN